MRHIFKRYQALIILASALIISACTGIPEGVTPEENFDQNRYLGKWYEIARLDHSFERGLEQVTATYTQREDGGIKVLNQGYHTENGEWEQAEGKAYFVGERDVGHLKVSFFGPFYASYVVAEIDHEAYQYALVTGPDTEYLWVLARQPSLDQQTLQTLVAKAKAYGFDTSALIYVNQAKNMQ